MKLCKEEVLRCDAGAVQHLSVCREVVKAELGPLVNIVTSARQKPQCGNLSLSVGSRSSAATLLAGEGTS